MEIDDAELLVGEASIIIENTIKNINFEIISMYWKIGKLINDYRTKHNSKYGDGVIHKFVKKLNNKYGKAFNKRNIYRMCLFNQKFEIVTPASQSMNKNNNKIIISSKVFISWSHYIELLDLKDNAEINYYLKEISFNKWSRQYLREQKENKAYQRLICNQKQDSTLPIEKSLKDPLILPVKKVMTEKTLENEIITNIEEFMQELGSGYKYGGRQQKMFINNSIYKVDLVFYNVILKRYVLIDLKIGKVKRDDIAQMQMYINYYNKHELSNGDNNTIGIILADCKNLEIIDYLNNDDNLYQIKYVTKMPDIKELEKIIKENTIFLLKR